MYAIEYESVKHLTLTEFTNYIKNLDGMPISKLKIQDLIYSKGKRIFPGEGVYIFRLKDKPYYVGKVSSMSFVERIPKHFDLRHGAWFNRLLTLTVSRHLGKELSEESINESAKFAIENLNLILINFENKEGINALESVLRATLNPLNAYKRKRDIDFDLTLSTLVL